MLNPDVFEKIEDLEKRQALIDLFDGADKISKETDLPGIFPPEPSSMVSSMIAYRSEEGDGIGMFQHYSPTHFQEAGRGFLAEFGARYAEDYFAAKRRMPVGPQHAPSILAWVHHLSRQTEQVGLGAFMMFHGAETGTYYTAFGLNKVFGAELAVTARDQYMTVKAARPELVDELEYELERDREKAAVDAGLTRADGVGWATVAAMFRQVAMPDGLAVANTLGADPIRVVRAMTDDSEPV